MDISIKWVINMRVLMVIWDANKYSFWSHTNGLCNRVIDTKYFSHKIMDLAPNNCDNEIKLAMTYNINCTAGA